MKSLSEILCGEAAGIMRCLSEIFFKNRYAICKECNEVFIDDYPMRGSIECPNEGCYNILWRNYSREDLEKKG